jgi:putative Holliday junction resolvase
MNILGIDFGTKNIGLAWCDTAIGVPLPFGVANSIDEITKIVKEERINKIVIGLPVGLDGKENKNTERVKKFANELKLLTDISIDLYDERFSSQAADKMKGLAGRDEKSAMIILSDYLQKNKIL